MACLVLILVMGLALVLVLVQFGKFTMVAVFAEFASTVF